MADVMRVSIIGTLPSGEEFSVNPVFKIGGDFPISVSNLQAQQIATALTAITVPTQLRTMITAACAYTKYRVEARTYAGVLEAQAEGIRTTPAAGTGTTGHPYQVSIVASLRTGRPGASGRGRLYWPYTGGVVNSTSLRLSPTDPGLIGAATKTFLSDIRTAIAATLTGVSLVVWSRVGASAENVTSIQVGDVLDVQRRRRDALIEAYTTTAYP